MLKRLLIANRGEIARRIIRTCTRLGVETVAVYSDADAQASFVREADQAVRLGPAPARESYLDAAKVLAAARESGADSVHPGYGFLSENAEFAEAVVAAGLVWVGPPASAIRAMGLKDAAKARMISAGVPVTPGYQGEDQGEARLQAEANRLGYPVLIKAVAGGGGKGMRRVEVAAEFAAALASCRREAASSFGDERVLIETYVARPRHIEVQVFADAHGNAVHLFERDCSLQRRHQKVIEEAPAPGMDEATRQAVCASAVKAALAVGYQGAGTIEFIADASEGLRADRIWFMEMNTRLQVEHPVTEAITGQDLVEWQLRVASGEPLPKRQDALAIDGWAMEARLYAENPASGFLPSTGKLEHFRLPSPTGANGVRVDSAVEQGCEVTPFYDPMIAKLIAHAPTREAAAAKLAAACREVEVWPVKTNAAFLARCLADPDFVAGRVDTGFIGARLEGLVGRQEYSSDVLVAAAGVAAYHFRPPHGPPQLIESPWTAYSNKLFGFRLNQSSGGLIVFTIDGSLVVARCVPLGPTKYSIEISREIHQVEMFYGSPRELRPRTISIDSRPERIAYVQLRDYCVVFVDGSARVVSSEIVRGEDSQATGGGAIASPMPGRVVSVQVTAGQRVAKGQALLAVEAMKMEHVLSAPFDGVVAELNAEVGQQVAEGATLVRLEAA